MDLLKEIISLLKTPTGFGVVALFIALLGFVHYTTVHEISESNRQTAQQIVDAVHELNANVQSVLNRQVASR